MATERAVRRLLYSTVHDRQCRARWPVGEEGEDEGRRGRCRGGSRSTQRFTEHDLGECVNVCVMVIGCVVQLDTRGV